MSVRHAVEVGAFLLLSCLGASPVRGQPSGEDSNATLAEIADEPTSTDPAAFLPAALSVQGTRDFSNSSLREMIAWLREEHGLAVLIDENALLQVGVSTADPISDRLQVAPLYLLLNRLGALGLAWYYEDDILHITSAKRAEQFATTLPHNVGDLLDAGYELSDLEETIISTVAPDSWMRNGTGDGVLNSLGDVLFVRQSAKIHRDVAGLLAALRNHARQTFVNDPPQHARLRNRLDETVSVEFTDVPLVVAVAELAQIAGADIRLDRPALRDQRIREREPMTLHLADRKLSTVLQAIALDLDLTSILRDGVLWITTTDEAESFQKTAVYDVRDLCRDADESEALVDAITSQTEPESWEDNGSGIGALYVAKPGVIVISQEERIHMAVLDLLEMYRTALRLSKPRDRGESADPNEIVTVYYRLNASVADDLAELLPRLVAPETWRHADRPDAPGEIYVAASKPDLTKIASLAGDGRDARRSLVVEQAVLILSQKRSVHDEIA
ncbi:MAG: hypothetical protein AAF961_02615, partial [Planctomycetota bacterium]